MYQVSADFSFGDFEIEVEEQVSESVMLSLEAIGRLLVNKMRQKLNHAGTGHIYPSRNASKAWHVASAPGEPPAPDRGEYRDSWTAETEKTEYGTYSLRLMSSLWEKFGRRLELGGWGGGVYIAPRPHVRPVWEQSAPEINTALERYEQ
jgi:hypothetical protein